VAGERNSTLVMPVPVELLRFFEKMAPGPAHPEHEPPAELDDLGDAEVAAAEAAISHENVPQLGSGSIRDASVPELEEASIPPMSAVDDVLPTEVRQVTAPGLATEDAKGNRA
jgi:hypothetical protein